jgi:hypothetical protein
VPTDLAAGRNIPPDGKQASVNRDVRSSFVAQGLASLANDD